MSGKQDCLDVPGESNLFIIYYRINLVRVKPNPAFGGIFYLLITQRRYELSLVFHFDHQGLHPLPGGAAAFANENIFKRGGSTKYHSSW
jgi:hypothetical protein